MPKLTLLEEFDIAVRVVARDADTTQTSRELAERFYDEERDLVETFDREWKVEKLANLIGKERAKLRRAENPQLRLGFKAIRRKIVLESGRELREGDATLWTLRLWKRQLGKEDHPLVAEIERRIAFMEPWSAKKRGITFAKACKLEADGN